MKELDKMQDLIIELRCMLVREDTAEKSPRIREKIVEAKAELTRFSSKIKAIGDMTNAAKD